MEIRQLMSPWLASSTQVNLELFTASRDAETHPSGFYKMNQLRLTMATAQTAIDIWGCSKKVLVILQSQT
jgi:hypothetical protein